MRRASKSLNRRGLRARRARNSAPIKSRFDTIRIQFTILASTSTLAAVLTIQNRILLYLLENGGLS